MAAYPPDAAGRCYRIRDAGARNPAPVPGGSNLRGLPVEEIGENFLDSVAAAGSLCGASQATRPRDRLGTAYGPPSADAGLANFLPRKWYALWPALTEGRGTEEAMA
jgi:hypothetical protein